MITNRPLGLNTSISKELLKEAPEGVKPTCGLSLACCSRILSALEGSGESEAVSEKKLRFNEYATRHTYTQVVAEVQLPPSSPTNWFVSQEHVIDEFHSKDDEELLSLGADPKKIEGKWVVCSEGDLSPLGACYAMLMMDAGESLGIPSSRSIREAIGELDSGEISIKGLRSAALLLKPDRIELGFSDQNYLSTDKKLKKLLTKEKEHSWSAVIAILQTPTGLHPVILDEYDPSMSILFIRDPSKGKSFSMHIDDFVRYNPNRRFITAAKYLSDDEIKEYNSIATSKSEARDVHQVITNLVERFFLLCS